MVVLSRRLLYEPYLDAALHDVLLHLPSQIPDHTPYTDRFLVLLPSTNIDSRVCNIHIYDNSFYSIEPVSVKDELDAHQNYCNKHHLSEFFMMYPFYYPSSYK
jgi:hypothetical protein